jgi:hypothetical protein
VYGRPCTPITEHMVSLNYLVMHVHNYIFGYGRLCTSYAQLSHKYEFFSNMELPQASRGASGPPAMVLGCKVMRTEANLKTAAVGNNASSCIRSWLCSGMTGYVPVMQSFSHCKSRVAKTDEIPSPVSQLDW